MKKLSLALLSIIIIFIIAIFILGYKFPKKDIHEDWPYFPENNNPEFILTKYDSMSIFKINVADNSLFMEYCNEDLKYNSDIFGNIETLYKKGKAGVMDFNGNMFFIIDHFCNNDSINYFYTDITNENIFELVNYKKDSTMKLYSFLNGEFKKNRESLTQIDDHDIDTLGKLYLYTETFTYPNSTTYFLLRDSNYNFYAHKTENFDSDFINNKNITTIIPEKEIINTFNNVQIIDSVVFSNKLNFDILSGYNIGFEKSYIFYYQMSINNKISNFKINGLSSKDLSNQFFKINSSEKTNLFLDDTNNGYVDSTNSIYKNEIGNMKLYKISVK